MNCIKGAVSRLIKKGLVATVTLLILTISLFSTSLVNASSPSELIAHWALDEGSGSVAGDSSVNHYDGSVIGAVWTAGKSGDALSFNGGTNYVSLPVLPLYHVEAVTVSTCASTDFSQQGFMVYYGDNGEFILSNEVDQRFSFGVKLDNELWYGVTTQHQYDSNVWHQVVGVWTKGVGIQIYVDGQLDNENNAIGGGYLFAPYGPFSASLGVYAGGFSGYRYAFKGLIDDVSIYNGALSASEISASYDHIFFVVPEYAFGTLAALIVPLVALAALGVRGKLKRVSVTSR
jgi:hypothetical protein